VSRDTGVCLTIPEGAVRHGCDVEIFLAVLRDDRDRPKLSGLYFTVLKFTNIYNINYYLTLDGCSGGGEEKLMRSIRKTPMAR